MRNRAKDSFPPANVRDILVAEMRTYYVYIMSDRHRGTLYTGVTNNLERRVSQHRSGDIEGFTSTYHVHVLVYYESMSDALSAIAREKQIKGWIRAKKVALIEGMNPDWDDLSETCYEADPPQTQTPPPPQIPSRRVTSPTENVVVAQNDTGRCLSRDEKSAV